MGSSDLVVLGDFILSTASTLASLTAAEFLVGHPFDAVKTKMQAATLMAPPAPTARRIVKAVWRDEGVSGFYRGGAANLSRMMAKAAYRAPVRPAVKSFYADRMPSTYVATATGFTMAVTDVVILTPFERMKVWLMTHSTHCRGDGRHALRQFLHDGRLVEELYRGFGPSLARSVLSWVAYLNVEAQVDSKLRERGLGMDSLAGGVARSVVTGFIGGGVSAALMLPFDNAKTQQQRSSVAGREDSVMAIWRRIYAVHGWRGLYFGWTVRLPHYVLIGALQAQVIPRMDAHWVRLTQTREGN